MGDCRVCHEADEICAFPYFYAAYSSGSFPKFLLVSFFLLEDETETLSRKVGKELPLYAA